MASFTSDLHDFHPYVKTLPTSEYATVGLYKQQKYEEGFGKIQQYFDTIAGLPIDKSAARTYVQGKLGEVKKAMGENISGDFSDMRLINQVGGATHKIEADPIVVNAMASTAKGRAGVAAMEEAKKTGKGYGVENELAFTDAYSKWQNDGKLDSSFQGGYIPYVDVLAMGMEVVKAMGESEGIPPDAFRLGADGKTVEVNPVLFKGKSLERVQNALNLVYQKPEVQQQLAITAKYKFQGATPQDLQASLNTYRDNNMKFIDDSIAAINLKKSMDASYDSEKATNQLKELEDMKLKLKKDYEENTELIKTNPFAYTVNKVKDDISSNFTQAFATSVMEKSPLFDAKMDMARLEIQRAEYDLKMRKEDNDAAAAALKASKGGDQIPVVTTVGKVKDDAGRLNKETFNKLVEKHNANFQQGALELVHTMVNNGSSTGSPNPVKVVNGVYSYNIDPTGKTGYKTAKEAQDKFATIYGEARALTMGPNADANLIDAFKKLDPLIRTARKYQYAKKDIEQRAIEIEQGVRDKVNQKLTEMGYTKPEYKEYTDAYLVDNKVGNWEAAQERFTKKYGKNWAYRIGALNGANKTEEYENFASFFGPAIKGELSSIDEEYKNKQSAFKPLISSIQAAEPKDKETTRIQFANIAQAYAQDSGSDKDFRNMLYKDNKDYFKDNIYGGYQDPLTGEYFLTISHGDEKEPKKQKVSKEEFESIPGFKTTNEFWNKFGDDLTLTHGVTTDVPVEGYPSGGGANTAYIMNMPADSKYDVRYHVTGNGTDGNYNLKLYIFEKPYTDKKTGKIVEGKEVLTSVNAGISATMDGVMAYINNMNDILVQSFIVRNKPQVK